MAPPEAPVWRRTFDDAERNVGKRLEAVVQTPQFAETVVVVTQLEREMRRRFERVTRRVIHALNLPTGSDIKRLSHQIADLDHRVRDLSRSLEADGGPAVLANGHRPETNGRALPASVKKEQ